MPRLVSDDTAATPRSPLISGGTTDIGQTSPRSLSPAPSVVGSKGDDNDSEVQTPRSVSDSDGTSPLDESGCQDSDDYYAFLRELAGSFEATSEDDESEVGSEDGTGDEEESPPLGRKRSSAWSDETDSPEEDDGSPVSPHLPVHTKAQQGEAQDKDKDSGKGNGRKASGRMHSNVGSQDAHTGSTTKSFFKPPPRGQLQGVAMLGTITVAACWQQSTVADMGGLRRPAVGWSAGESPIQSPPSTFGMIPGSANTQRAPERERPCPSQDRRRPVVDDYDVIKATAAYAQQRGGTVAEQRRTDLQAAIDLRMGQAKKLLGVAQKENSDPDIRSHYARVRTDLLKEVRVLESQLSALDEATEETPAVQESLFGPCDVSVDPLALPLEGGRPRSVAVH